MPEQGERAVVVVVGAASGGTCLAGGRCLVAGGHRGCMARRKKVE